MSLDDLSIVAVASFTGNIWTGEGKPVLGFFIDERADEDEVDAFGFKWSWPGRSSKHFPFEWSSEDQY